MTRMMIVALMIGSLLSVRPAATYAANTSGKFSTAGLMTMDELMANKDGLADRARQNLNEPEAQALLGQLGISPAEAAQRISALSDSEIQQILKGETTMRAGGDILYLVLMVLLIIFVAQRI